MKLSNPKRRFSKSNDGIWYPYYAGYSPEFVKDVISSFDFGRHSTIMDPWNGSGTTTSVARNMGLNCLGFDINPVMVLVGKSRCLDQSVQQSLVSIGKDILDRASSLPITNMEEALETWLTPEGASIFRNIERTIRHILVDKDKDVHPYYSNLEQISSLAAFYYVALFRTIRDEMKVFKTSNPTWIKKPKKADEFLHPNPAEIGSRFLTHITQMSMLLPEQRKRISTAMVQKASSINLPLGAETVDAVITSPPYCTRIDYAIATLPELAILGCSPKGDVKKLRNEMIGSPVIIKLTPQRQSEWGARCLEFLRTVEEHTSLASSTYYLKNYLQYFDLMFKSMLEINRTLKKRGSCALVVQESYYKEVLLDLPGVIEEMAQGFSWKLTGRYKFGVKQSMVDLNAKSKKYRTRNNTQENVLIFQRT